MNGKDKCRILKDIRRQIAEQNEIEWVVSECRHKGNCKGTCPKCESEVRQLERALENRRRLGKVVAVAGISAACLTGLTACTMDDFVEVGTKIIDQVKEAAANSRGSGTGTETPDPVKPGDVNPDIPEPTDLDGDVAYIPDDLSGYMEYDGGDTIQQPKEDSIAVKDQDQDDDLVWLDGEVPIEYSQSNY